MPAAAHPRTIEGMVMNVKTVGAAIALLIGSVVTGTWTLAQSANDIETNKTDIEQIQTVQTQAVADVKRGISNNAQAIDQISRKFDLLLQELHIREVISETASEAPTQ